MAKTKTATAPAEMGIEVPAGGSYFDQACDSTPHFVAVSNGYFGRGFSVPDALDVLDDLRNRGGGVSDRAVVYHVDAGTEFRIDGSFATPAGKKTPTLIYRFERNDRRKWNEVKEWTR